eukprot:TRINITY_DN3867_c0_g1_i1.p1 TRINITY_DN3867_c0_g1~~TRINITY_DN3867_c0_g1_i1.p1  ORF type:complete len:1663 (+),score=332.82 TRINITY_DN3867_c0_g1_i1:7805-12793(+)
MQHIYPRKYYTHCIIVICFVLLSIAGKTQNTENLIVKTFSMGNWSNLPVVYSNQVKGGIHQVESISDGLTDNLLLDLDEIPTERLQKGMLVNVFDADGNGSKACFQYTGDGSTNTFPGDWTQVRLLYTWTSGEYYPQGCMIQQNNNYYICNTAHTAGADFDAIETAKWDKIATHNDINTLQDSDQDTKVEVEQSADEDKIRFTTSGSERMIIDNSGKIGIGTSTPTARAEIEGNGETVLKLKQNGSWSGTQWGLYVEGYSYLNGFRVNAEDGIRALHKVNTGGQLGFSTQGNDPITFTQSSTIERMRIASGGNVGIGTNAPSAKLDVNGQIRLRGGNPGANKILQSDANGVGSWVNLSGDATLSGGTLTIGNSKVTNAKIADDAVTSAKIGTAGAGDADKVLSTDGSGNPQWEAKSNFASSTLTDGQIFVGNDLNVATGVTPSGDVTITNAGVTTIGTGTVNSGKIADGQVMTADIANLNVTEGKIAANAVSNTKIANDAVTTAKIGTAGLADADKILTTTATGDPQWEAKSNFASSTLTNGQILVGDGTNVATGVTPTGDVTISNTGVTTIGANKITSGKITDGEVKTADIANLNVTEDKLAASAVTNGKIADNAVTTSKIGTAGAGDADKVLTTTAAGDPQWEAKSALGDDLGNHTATQNIKLSGNYLSNDGGNEGIFVATDGKVGIGTNTPSSPLHISQNVTADQGLLIVESNDPDIFFNDTDGGYNTFTFKNNNVNTWAFGRNSSDNFYITRFNTTWDDNTFNIIKSTGNIGIGTNTPGAKLEIAGQVKITGGTPGANKLLTSDANGLASWVAPSFASSTLSDGQLLVGNASNVATGVTPTGDVTISNAGVTTIGTGTVNSGKIADGQVMTADIANLNVTEGKIAASAISTTKIADNAVTSAKIGTAGAGDANKVLTTTAAGDPQWEAKSALGDNLGNHTATENIKLSGNYLSNDGGNEGIFVATDGKVGMGTNTPGYQLDLSSANEEVFRAVSTKSGDSYIKIFNLLAPNLANSQTIQFSFGRSLANGDVAEFAFEKGADSRIKIGTYGNADILSLYHSGKSVFTGNVGLGTTTPLAKLHAGTTISDYATLDFSTTGAVITANSGDQNDAESNVLTLMRDGTSSVVYAGAARFDMSQWETNGTNASTKLDIKLANTSTDDLNSVLTMQSNGNVGVGTTTPGARLEVAGQVKITGGTPGANKILTSDANGLASWVAPSFASSTLTNGQVFVGNASNVATGVTPSGDVTISNTGITTIGANKITSGKITDGEVKTADIANLNVTEGKLATSAVTNGKIADNAVTTAKIGTAGAGDANKVLTTDGSGNPQWEAKSALGDNLGNHTATQDISLGTHKIKGSGTTTPFELSEAYIRFAENLNTDAQIRSYANLILWANDDNGGTEHMIFKVGGTGTGTERMRLSSTGNLGIGTTSPNDKLVVRNGAGEIRFGGSNGRTLSAYENGSTLANFDFHAVQTYFNSDFLIAPGKKISTSNGSTDNLYLTTTNTSKAIYIDRKVGIGTNAPSNQLHVNTSSDPIRAQGLQSASDNEIVTVDANGVFHKKAANVSGISTKNADYTATANDETLLADATTANMTITLPSATGNTGLKITIKRIDTSSNTLSISGNTATIDGQASVTMNVAWQAYTFQCDGTNWYIIGRF